MATTQHSTPPQSGYPDTATEAIWHGELAQRHRDALEVESAISTEAIAARGYFTATDTATLRRHDFSKSQALTPAIVVPLYNWKGERAGVAIRHTIPRTDKNGKVVKYDQPVGAPLVLDVAPHTRHLITDKSVPLIITEGAKKADAAASRGLCAINSNGVWGFQKGAVPLADWEELRPYLRGRVVFIAYDSDVSRKRGVETAMRRLENLLRSLGAIVKVIYLTDGPKGEKTGLDDFFARGGTVERLWTLARDLESVEESNRNRREREKVEARAKVEEEAKSVGAVVIETHNRQQSDELADLSHAVKGFNARTPTLFFGFDGLVKIERDAKDVPRLRRANRPTIQAVAGRAAKWIRTSEREGVSNVAPPRELCEIYLNDQESWRGIPAILGTASAPFFAPDGTLCASTGYHQAARLWLELTENFEVGDTTPTPENIEIARRLILNEILGEVAFADNASRAHAVAQMFLPFVRSLIKGPTPLHLWNAPLRGSGKSYAAELCILPFVEPTPTPEKTNAEEWRKSLLAELQTGPSHIFLDNIKGNLNSAALDMAITTGVFRDRMTGTGDMVSAPARCVWVATANNAELTEDAATRSILIQLDPNCENPESREFCGSPHKFIQQNKGRVCGAIITIIKAWQSAGCPDYSGPNRCRFPDWARTVGGILDRAEIEGFLDNIEEARASIGDASSDWHEFTEAWLAAHGEKCANAADLMPLALKVEELATPLELIVPGPRREKVLAEKIKKQRDRVFGSFKVKLGPDLLRKKTFKLEKVEIPTPTTPKTTPETPETSETPYIRGSAQESQNSRKESEFLNKKGTSAPYSAADVSGVSGVNPTFDDAVFDDETEEVPA